MQPELATAPPVLPLGADVALEPELQAFIGRQLQATYDEVLNEPVPNRFLDLLRQLETDPSQSGQSQPQSGTQPSEKAGKR